MADKKPATKKKPAPKTFSAEERAAARERMKELKAGDGDGEAQLTEKISQMKPPDRALAEKIRAIVKTAAPGLKPKLWYGMPAWARDGAVVCFFQAATKFKTRYATLGFSDKALLDDGTMWPNAYALTTMSAADEERIAALIRKAAG